MTEAVVICNLAMENAVPQAGLRNQEATADRPQGGWTALIVWRMSHRLFGMFYSGAPYPVADKYELESYRRAVKIGAAAEG